MQYFHGVLNAFYTKSFDRPLKYFSNFSRNYRFKLYVHLNIVNMRTAIYYVLLLFLMFYII